MPGGNGEFINEVLENDSNDNDSTLTFDVQTGAVGEVGDNEDQQESVPVQTATSAAPGTVAQTHRLLREKGENLRATQVKSWIFTMSDGAIMTDLKKELSFFYDYRAKEEISKIKIENEENFWTDMVKTPLQYNIIPPLENIVSLSLEYIQHIEDNGKSEIGALRYNLVKQIYELAMNELLYFTRALEEFDDDQLREIWSNFGTWEDYIYNARSVSLSDVDNRIQQTDDNAYKLRGEDGSVSLISSASEDIEKASNAVATTRLAEQLGVGDTVQKSATGKYTTSKVTSKEVAVTEKARRLNGETTDEERTYHLKSMNVVITEQVGGETMVDLMDKAREEKVGVKLSPNAIRQLFTLQVFDLVCGQTGRDQDNIVADYTAVKKDGKITGYIVNSVKGVGNEDSSGVDFNYDSFNVTSTNANGQKFRGLGNARSIVDENGVVTVPFLPRSFYNSIVGYDAKLGSYALKDVRNDKQIEMLNSRITHIKEELVALVTAGKIVLLDNDTQWQKVYNMLEKGELVLGNGYIRKEDLF